MLYVDARNAGISGDMLIAGLLDLGADPGVIDKVLEPIQDIIGRYKTRIEKTHRGVYRSSWYRFEFKDKEIPYSDARAAIKNAELSPEAGKIALKAFDTLAAAESRVHGKPLEELHLHDVPDTIADFTVAAGLLDVLGLLDGPIISSPVNTGKGFFTFHGHRSTLPAPATAEILKGVPVMGTVDMELTTPTGAALLTALTGDFIMDIPQMRIRNIGYGAGYKDKEGFANVLKLYVADTIKEEVERDSVMLLETNVDTATGEDLGSLFELLLGEGALDVVLIPCIMKKNRPGHIIQVMCRSMDTQNLTRHLMRETGSLGLRMTPEVHRQILKRSIEERTVNIHGKNYKVRIKKATDKEGIVISSRPEFEDLKRISKETGLGIRRLRALAEASEESQGKPEHQW